MEFGVFSISHTEPGTVPPVICPMIPVEGSRAKALPNYFENLGILGCVKTVYISVNADEVCNY